MTYIPQSTPAVNAIYPAITGAVISNDATTPNTALNVSAGLMRDQTDTYDINIGNFGGDSSYLTPNTPTKLNATLVGPGGIDTGALQASKLYYIYVIGDSSLNKIPSLLLSLSSPTVSPTMPFGYDIYRMIGYIKTDASSHFLPGYWYGTNNERKFAYATPFQVGSALNATAKATISLGNVVPPEQNLQVIINATLIPNAASNVATFYPYNAASSQKTIIGQVATVNITDQFTITTLLNAGVPALSYTVSAGTDSLNVFVFGFEYTI